MPAGPGGVGIMKRIRLLRSLEQSKALSQDIENETAQLATEGETLEKQKYKHRMELKKVNTGEESLQQGKKSSRKRKFVSSFSHVEAPSTDSHIFQNTRGKSITTPVAMSTLKEDTGLSSHHAEQSTSHPANGDEAVTAMKHQKKGQTRGVAKGHKLDKEVEKHGKYKIWFLPRETIAVNFDSDLSNAIGLVVRTTAEIEGATRWKEVSDINKELCYTRLKQWDWGDERVQRIIHDKFQSAYTRWRCTLHKCFESLFEEGIDPRDVCPRKDLTMEKWQMACDFIEKEDYQEKSIINSRNRAKMTFHHTSGRRTMLSRYNEMTDKSEIELFKVTHVRAKTGGEFVNSIAQEKYNEMIKLKWQSKDNDEEPISEAGIMKTVLGHRSGYIKGMGHGVQVLSSRGSNILAGVNLKEKLLELENA